MNSKVLATLPCSFIIFIRKSRRHSYLIISQAKPVTVTQNHDGLRPSTLTCFPYQPFSQEKKGFKNQISSIDLLQMFLRGVPSNKVVHICSEFQIYTFFCRVLNFWRWRISLSSSFPLRNWKCHGHWMFRPSRCGAFTRKIPMQTASPAQDPLSWCQWTPQNQLSQVHGYHTTKNTAHSSPHRFCHRRPQRTHTGRTMWSCDRIVDHH